MLKQKVVISDVRSINRNGKVTGHYFSLAQNYIDVLEDEFEVYVAGGPIYKNQFKNYIELPFDTDLSKNEIINKFKVIMNCLALFAKTKGYTIILQSNAVVTTFFSMILSPFKRNVYMIQYNTMALDSRIKRVLHKLAKNKITGILCPSENIGEQYGVNYLVLPDYIVTSRQIMDLKKTKSYEKKYDIGVVGIITPDKGIVEAAKFLAEKPYKVLIAGRPVSEKIRNELEQVCFGKNNIELRLEYINDEMYDTAIRLSKYCLLNYTDAYSEHSSGVIFDVMYRGVPIIGRRCKFLDVVQEKQMGYLYDEIAQCDFEKLFDEKMILKYQDGIKKHLEDELRVKSNLCSFLRCENDK